MGSRSRKFFIGVAVVCLAILAALMFINRSPSLHTKDAVRMAVDAYIYGYPLVTFDMARKQQTNVAVPDEQHAPVNQMINMRTYLPIDNHCCAAPNADTLYTIAWLDVAEEPWLLSVPEIRDRYYIVPLLDGFSEVIKVVSSINDGAEAQTLAVVVGAEIAGEEGKRFASRSGFGFAVILSSYDAEKIVDKKLADLLPDQD